MTIRKYLRNEHTHTHTAVGHLQARQHDPLVEIPFKVRPIFIIFSHSNMTNGTIT